MMLREAVLGVLVCGVVAAGCSSGDDVEARAAAEAVPANVLAAELSVEADEAVRLAVTATAGDHVVELPVTAEAAEQHTIPVVGLRAGRDYELEVELLDDEGAEVGSKSVGFTTGELPEFIPDLSVTVDSDGRADGLTLVELNPRERQEFADDDTDDPLSVQHVVALDADGEIVWYSSSGEAMGDVRLTEDGEVQSINFPVGLRRTDLLGNVTSYWAVRPEVMPWFDPSDLEGAPAPGQSEAELNDAIVLDPEWVDLRSIHHEVYPMPDGNLLGLSNTLYELTPQQRAQLCPGDTEEFWAISDVAVEFTPEGEVLRTWDMWDVLDIMEVPGEEMCSTTGQIADEIERDWTHGNAIVYDPNREAVIFSNRHTSNIVAMSRGEDEGPQTELRWVIGSGGTVPLDGDGPRYQHAVELAEDGSLLFYDNGNRREGTSKGGPNPPYSRAVLYEVDDSSRDPSEWTATQRWEHRTDEAPGEPAFAGFLGDADRLPNGNVLVAHGGIPEPEPDDDHNRCFVIEVVPDDGAGADEAGADEYGSIGGEVVWRLETGTPDRPVTCYRAAHVESLYAGPNWTER